MKITLNNRPEIINSDSVTIEELIKIKNFTFKMLVTKINGKLVKSQDRNTAIVNEGDDVQIIHLISGG